MLGAFITPQEKQEAAKHALIADLQDTLKRYVRKGIVLGDALLFGTRGEEAVELYVMPQKITTMLEEVIPDKETALNLTNLFCTKLQAYEMLCGVEGQNFTGEVKELTLLTANQNPIRFRFNAKDADTLQSTLTEIGIDTTEYGTRVSGILRERSQIKPKAGLSQGLTPY